MKGIILAALIAATAVATAQADTYQLSTPHTVELSPAVSVPRCSAVQTTTAGYATVVTGFSADGNYVLGQVSSGWVCGSSGRGGTLHSYSTCVHLTWDLGGNLISASGPVGFTANGTPVSTPCAAASPEAVFDNAAGYVAETEIYQACGSVACYATYYYPTLVTP